MFCHAAVWFHRPSSHIMMGWDGRRRERANGKRALIVERNARNPSSRRRQTANRGGKIEHPCWCNLRGTVGGFLLFLYKVDLLS